MSVDDGGVVMGLGPRPAAAVRVAVLGRAGTVVIMVLLVALLLAYHLIAAHKAARQPDTPR